MDKKAICVKNYYPFKSGEIVKCDFMESYSNEWVSLHDINNTCTINLDVELFEKYFKII